jgi:ATP-dependent DNA helicase RecG
VSSQKQIYALANKPSGLLDYFDEPGKVISLYTTPPKYSKLRGARIRLFMFADRLLLCVPGPLPNSMSIETMTRMSLPRNDVICSLLARIPVPDVRREFITDKRGAGVEAIMQESTALSGRAPEYRQIADMELQLTLYAAPSPHG